MTDPKLSSVYVRFLGITFLPLCILAIFKIVILGECLIMHYINGPFENNIEIILYLPKQIFIVTVTYSLLFRQFLNTLFQMSIRKWSYGYIESNPEVCYLIRALGLWVTIYVMILIINYISIIINYLFAHDFTLSSLITVVAGIDSVELIFYIILYSVFSWYLLFHAKFVYKFLLRKLSSVS